LSAGKSLNHNTRSVKLDAVASEMVEKEWSAVRDALASRGRRGVAKKNRRWGTDFFTA
jgi:hypothetical protein